jgi:hypothetical protein
MLKFNLKYVIGCADLLTRLQTLEHLRHNKRNYNSQGKIDLMHKSIDVSSSI